MLKHSETIINTSIRRQDGSWDYRWDYYNREDPNTIFLRPEMDANGEGNNTTWYFQGDADELRKYDESTWDPNHPIFEYKVDDTDSGEGPDDSTDQWDSNHPQNKTRYLRPGDSSFMRITNTVKNVTIDPIPPEFISDYGTEYLSLECAFDGSTINDYRYSTATRRICVEFKDEVGLDYKQIIVLKGAEDVDPTTITPDNDKIIYYYDRTLEEAVHPDYVRNISFNATRSGQYQVNIHLYEKWGEKLDDGTYELVGDIKDELNEGVTIIIFDLSGNYSLYKLIRPFKTLAIDDLNKLVPVIINFVDIEPNNYFLEDGVEGKIVTQVQDPNKILWEYENVFDLLETSIGVIDPNAIESNLEHNPLDGLSQFIVTSLKESGNVEVEAWVQTGFDEIDELIKERTYNTAICGPWVYGDEGRKYHITPYIPKYLHGTEFADFMEFFQLYINTMYKSLESNHHISGLEKIARIANFNDIARIEDSLIYHYGKEFGNEFDFDVDSLQNVNLIQDGSGFTTRDTKETFEIIKYVLEQLPAYNRYKGTDMGITYAIKMFGFAAKVINLWTRIDFPIDSNPVFHEEDSLYSYDGFFMTSRFNLELNSSNNTFQTFCDNIDMFIDLVKSIKPITKILNLIKYVIPIDKNINLIYSLDEVTDDNSKDIEYTMTWKLGIDNIDDVYNLSHICQVDGETGNAKLIGFNYTPECKCVIDGSEVPAPSNVFNILGKFFKCDNEGIVFKIEKGNEVDTYKFDNYEAMLNAGSFYLFLKGDNGTKAKSLLEDIDAEGILDTALKELEEGEEPDHSKDVIIETKIVLQPGTNYVKCTENEI
jgi:hypothetical protein